MRVSCSAEGYSSADAPGVRLEPSGVSSSAPGAADAVCVVDASVNNDS